jgi:hypothetical protein
MFQILRPPPGTFLRLARSRGVPLRVARLLEPAAEEICPQQPARILESRELFERAALHAAAGKGGNLELSFRVVDLLATTLETMGLARSSDVPDPFRRVWVRNESGSRWPAVVLACGDGEIAVLCPPRRSPIPDAGQVLRLSYRGFSSPAEYDLRLDDPVRLPRGLILNLVRLDGRGSIGRAHERFPVYFQAQVRRHPPETGGEELETCEILDFASNGVRMECATAFETGHGVWIEMPLPDGEQPFATPAVVRWARAGSEGQRSHGLLFTELSKASRERLDRFLETLQPS